jgi:integrase
MRTVSQGRKECGVAKPGVRACDRRHPRTCGAADVKAFLVVLATTSRVSASTQNQALAALRFLYAVVLEAPLELQGAVPSARQPERLPSVLSREEVRSVLAQMRGATRLLAALLYGSGLRLMEACTLRVKDVDFARGQITVRRGKGAKDRVTVLPPLRVENRAVAPASRASHGGAACGDGRGATFRDHASGVVSHVASFPCDGAPGVGV